MKKEEMYQDFKNKECKEFRILGTLQMVCFILFVLCWTLLIWIDFSLFVKIEVTLLLWIGIIAAVYHYMDKFYRKLFDEEYEKDNA